MPHDFVYIGHPILRKKCAPIITIDQSILSLIEEMKEVIKSFRGLGMAAPQIGACISLFITCFPIKNEKEEMVAGPAKVFINPTIEEPSKETWVAPEGNPCIPHIVAPVERPVSITVSYQDEAGSWHKERFSGWEAKIVMHENDHLQGVLFIDRLSFFEKRKYSREIERLKKKYKQHNEQFIPWKD